MKRLPQFWFQNNKRLSCLKRAYLKTEKDTPLTLEDYKFTTECLAGVTVVTVGEVNDSVVENFEKYDLCFYWFQILNGGYLIGRGK